MHVFNSNQITYEIKWVCLRCTKGTIAESHVHWTFKKFLSLKVVLFIVFWFSLGYYFSRYGQPDTISSLLEYGINIDVDNQGWTALQLAVLNGHTDIVSILLNKGADTSIVNRLYQIYIVTRQR